MGRLVDGVWRGEGYATKKTGGLSHIERHDYASHRSINPTGIVPLGPEIDLSRPHGRDRR